MRMDKGQPFMDVEADYPIDGKDVPTFSEAFLYEGVGKGDARFILGVADEYEHVIDALGPTAVKAILDVKPQLVQRLGVGETVVKELEDARSDDDLRREEQNPSQVILDEKAAHDTWRVLHDEYTRLFNPEESMGADKLRAYNTLTEALGSWEREQRQKEIDRLPEKLERQEERREEIRLKRERERNERLRRAAEHWTVEKVGRKWELTALTPRGTEIMGQYRTTGPFRTKTEALTRCERMAYGLEDGG